MTRPGQGESEGFELAERDLIEHAAHGDLHGASHIFRDIPAESEDTRAASAGEGDTLPSSEVIDDLEYLDDLDDEDGDHDEEDDW